MNEPKLIKKNNLTEKIIEKQKKYLIIAIVCVITLFIGSSYALLTNFDTTDDVVTFKTGNLNMTVNNTLINLEGKLPENDTNGLANATPITLTLTNTGTMFIDGYEVKLVSDKNQTSTLEDKYIKYAISEDGTSYTSPSILTENNNIIFSGYDLEVDASKTIYLKVWVDEAAGNNALDKTYYGSVEVELYQSKEQPSYEMFKSVVKANQDDTCKTYVEEDGIIYISGTKDCIDFNYVWYSGKLWRITAIYPDGTMKMITDNNITTISYGPDTNFYTDENNTSYVYQWLNEDFLDTLYNYENIIVTDYKWNASIDDTDITTQLPKLGDEEAVFVTSPVGMLDANEYYKQTFNNSKEMYLNNDYYWFLLNAYSGGSQIWYSGLTNKLYDLGNMAYSGGVGIRPTIVLKSEIKFAGNGTKEQPYLINGDKELAIADKTFLNERTSGEYVTFAGEDYRIVGTEVIGGELTTKINKVDYIKNENGVVITKQIASTTSFGTGLTDDYWDYYLNNTWLKSIDDTYNEIDLSSNKLAKGTYYLGGYVANKTTDYKNAVCETSSAEVTIKDCIKTTNTWTGYVGLPRYGEMFATQFTFGDNDSAKMWLITPYTSYGTPNVKRLSSSGAIGYELPSSMLAARPSINLNSEIVITGGEGTPDKPYQIALPETE